MKRILTGFLAASMLLSLAACGGNNTPDNIPSLTGDTTEVPESHGVFSGMQITDFGGREFHMLVREANAADYYIEEETGDVYDDAVYGRNLAVEEAFNVKIKAIPVPGEWADKDNYLNLVQSSVMAGDGAFDLIDSYGASICGSLIANGIFCNLNEVEHLRLDSPWWSKQLQDELTTNGKLFAVTGDIATSMWKSLHVIFFNKKLAKEYQTESPYELVKAGKWTIDKFLDLIKDTAQDLNGDSKMTVDDRYGALFFDSLSFANFGIAFDIPTTVVENGERKLNLVSEKMLWAAETLTPMIHENENVHYMDQSTEDIINKAVALFTSDRALFYAGWLMHAETMRDMNADFGILPYPKADENQDSYYNSSRDVRSMIGIPVDAPDQEFSGMITEALCVAGSKIVIPVYRDIVLESKLSRDEESVEMLDIIREGLAFDFGIEFGGMMNDAGSVLRWSVNNNSALATYYASNEARYNEGFKQFMTVFDD